MPRYKKVLVQCALIFASAELAAAQQPAVGPKPTAKSAWLATLAKVEADAKALLSPDAAVQSQAAADLLAFVKANPGGAAANSKKWLPAMIESKHHAEVIQSTDLLLTSVAVDNVTSIESLLPYRIEAFKALNQPSDALLSAKQFYNVCSIKSSAAAEGIARSIRAKTRSIGAANAWILSLQSAPLPAPHPPAAPAPKTATPALPPDTP